MRLHFTTRVTALNDIMAYTDFYDIQEQQFVVEPSVPSTWGLTTSAGQISDVVSLGESAKKI